MFELGALFLFAIPALSIFFAGRAAFLAIRDSRRWRGIAALSGALLVVGAAGFFSQFLLGVGALTLPPSWEWPAGFVQGARTMPDGTHVVPLVPVGRIQTYDADWHFLRGWNPDARGGSFRIVTPPTGTIEVYTGRGQQHLSYTESGELRSSSAASDTETGAPSLSEGGPFIIVPTSPLLWPFSSPFISWALAALGGIVLAIVRRFGRAPPPSTPSDRPA
jgi:hypothetical protein